MMHCKILNFLVKAKLSSECILEPQISIFWTAMDALDDQKKHTSSQTVASDCDL